MIHFSLIFESIFESILNQFLIRFKVGGGGGSWWVVVVVGRGGWWWAVVNCHFGSSLFVSSVDHAFARRCCAIAAWVLES